MAGTPNAADVMTHVFDEARVHLRRSFAQTRRTASYPGHAALRTGLSVSDVLEAMLPRVREADDEYMTWFRDVSLRPMRSAIDLLDLANLLSLYVTNLTLTEWCPDTPRPPRLEALLELNAQAVVLVAEINCLVKNGLPTGAEARWRALHETAVVARLLSRRGQSLSTRYRASHVTDLHRRITGDERLLGPKRNWTKERRLIAAELAERASEILEVHGPEMAKRNGWAYPVVKKSRIFFEDIERAAGVRRRRRAYQWASAHVHAGRDGMFIRLMGGDEGTLRVGPRPDGIEAPLSLTIWASDEITGLCLREVARTTRLDEPLAWDACRFDLAAKADAEVGLGAVTIAMRRGDHERARELIPSPASSLMRLLLETERPHR